MYETTKLENQLKSIKLLYVEDDTQTRENALALFKDIFQDITLAVDGKDGLEKFKSSSFDLVITDISMPNLDGLNMVQEMKKLNKEICVILFTALNDINTFIQAIEIGVDHFINKPLQDIDLLFDKLLIVSKKIEYTKIVKEKERILKDREKIELMLKVIKLMGHHWRQPLSLIMSISSNYTLFKNEGDRCTNNDINNAKMVTKTVSQLSQMIKNLETLDFENSSIEEIEKIISISNTMLDE